MSQVQSQIAEGQHGIKAHSDGAPLVPVQTRSERFHSLSPDDFSKPTLRDLNWKYSALEQLAPLFDNVATDDKPGDPAVNYEIAEIEGIAVGTLAIGQEPRGETFRAEDLPAAIAWQQTKEALHLRVLPEAEIAEPVRVTMTGSGAQRRANAHLVIEAAEHSKAVVILEHYGAAQYSQNVEILVRPGAQLTLISLQEWDSGALHASSHLAKVGRDAKLKHITVTLGEGIVRLNPTGWLAEQGAEIELYGLYFSTEGQHIEHQVYVNHDAPHTVSNVNYKGALQGEGARAVWIGDVLIGRKATGTETYEQNRNLILTDGARADSIPNLEIETGDIAGAGHASATGRFDEEHLFYLQSRGIEERVARRLVTQGFLNEIVQKIGFPEMEEKLFEQIEEVLAQGAAK